NEYTILPYSIMGIHGYILVYSVTSLQSFQVVTTLHDKLYKSQGKTCMPVVLVGNKVDVSLERWEVRTEEGKKLVESWGVIFLESLAKESQGIQLVFRRIIEETDCVDNSCSRSTGCCLM
ncbi:PREDICTED: LOW QUALITY PROTEIN: GTPase RhebL1-like, partial [Acanthisitta chloris]|uniref:LOW QUALITY PROTEIN: GTPase RhebL1-like n=1 Tax=Acanthisitta chloris TaxID=57068 RepID=UPI0004F0F9B3